MKYEDMDKPKIRVKANRRKYDENGYVIFNNVHDRHCCSIHGCKYGDDDCTVVLGIDLGVDCESCEFDRTYKGED